MATFSSSSYLEISDPPTCFMASSIQHNLLNSPVPLMLPRRSSNDLDAHLDELDFQSNHRDSRHWSSNAPSSLSGLGIRNLDFSKDLESNDYSQGVPSVPHTQLNLDHRYRRRTPRLESMYDTLDEALDPFRRPLDNLSSIPPAWSFSSVIKAAELAADEAVYEMQSALSLEFGLGDLGTDSNLLDAKDQVSWAFSPATPRNLVSDFITQLSANDPTLKQTALFSEICFDSTSQAAQIFLGDGQTQMSQGECSKTSAAMNLIPELSLPLVDITICNANLQNACAGVNPADILPALPSPSTSFDAPLYLPYTSDSLSTNRPTVDGDLFGQDNVTNMEYPGFHTGAAYQTPHGIILPAPADAVSKYSKQASDDEHSTFHSPASSDYSPSLKSPVLKQTFSMRGNKRRIARTKSVEECELVYPETHDDHTQDLDLPINLGTPVLDAHRGVELEELKAKAERYRLRNQGRDYDKRWLISFAGKLSMRGELVEEFRCYITGCHQVNKRRDHILIHVGAHLDQRPFKCRHCSSRFLRKNECKRHELSHTGIRPYSCHLCPLPATTFVRQDLLKRHMKRTHRLDLEKVDKENNDTYRPKKKART